MKTDAKVARQKKAAKEIAEIMYASLQKFPKGEQEKRIRDIGKISAGIVTKRRGKPSKRVATPKNLPVSRRASTPR